MNDIEFYNLFKYISDHQNTVALININEFKRLVKIRGEYKFMPFKIGSLKYIPVKTDNFKERFKATNEMVNINLTPVWSFFTNDRPIITPKIESFELRENAQFKPKYQINRRISQNHNYFSNYNLDNLNIAPIIKEENAIEWDKKIGSILLASTDDSLLDLFLNHYKKELEVFNNIYDESIETAGQIKKLQLKIK